MYLIQKKCDSSRMIKEIGFVFDTENYEECLEAVQKNWKALRYISNPTPDIALIAAKAIFNEYFNGL